MESLGFEVTNDFESNFVFQAHLNSDCDLSVVSNIVPYIIIRSFEISSVASPPQFCVPGSCAIILHIDLILTEYAL